MLYLVKKELTANVRYLLLSVAVFILYMFIFAANGTGLFMMCSRFLLLCPVNDESGA